MASSIQDLVERLGCLERTTEALQVQLEKLTRSVSEQMDERLRHLEGEVAAKVDAASCEGLVQAALEELQSEVRGLQRSAGAQGQGGPLGAAAEEFLSASEDDSGDDDEVAEDGGSNLRLNFVVKHRDSTGASCGEISVACRSLERIAVVKKRAHEQLSVWCRFNSLGDDSAPSLPLLGSCRLYIEGDGGRRRRLRDRRLVAACGLEDGMRLFLMTAAPAASAAPAAPPAPEEEDLASGVAWVLSGQYNGMRPDDTGAAATVDTSDTSGQTRRTGPVTLRVQHETGETSVEALTSETVEVVKRRAHEQLGFWSRFSALSGGDEEDGAGLPPLRRCRLFTAAGGLPDAMPLEDDGRLADCGITDGALLFLGQVGS